ncbi:MAG: flagellar basal body P-ring formation chaperone FlgA [Rhizobiaceae bacterium]
MRRALTRMVVALVAVACAGAAVAQEYAIVTKRVVYPGETITAGLLQEVKLKAGRRVPANMAASAPAIEGLVAKRTLLPGRYIPLASLRDAYLIDQGVPVEIVFEQGGLSIVARGVTLQPGSEGDLVRVRNADSGATVTGTVMGDGTIRVGSS